MGELEQEPETDSEFYPEVESEETTEAQALETDQTERNQLQDQIEVGTDSLITIVSHRGSGKSVLCLALVNVWPDVQTIILDPLNSFEDLDSRGYVRVDTLDQFIEHYQSDEMPQYIRFKYASPVSAEAVFGMARELNQVLVVYDEADQLLINDWRRNPEPFNWMVEYGRHVEQGMILISRRPQAMPRNFTSQSTAFFRRMMEAGEQDWIRRRLGYIPEQLPKYCWYGHDLDGNIAVLSAEFIWSHAHG